VIKIKIQIKIGKLVLNGFDYHDHLRIGSAFEKELSNLITKNGLPEIKNNLNPKSTIDAGSIHVAPSAATKSIATQLASSVYNGLAKQR